jgi:hypothetical protein
VEVQVLSSALCAHEPSRRVARLFKPKLRDLGIGKDPAEPITDAYPGTSPYAFIGGTIKEAIVDVSGEHYVDLELEALAMMKRE